MRSRYRRLPSPAERARMSLLLRYAMRRRRAIARFIGKPQYVVDRLDTAPSICLPRFCPRVNLAIWRSRRQHAAKRQRRILVGNA